MNISELNDIKKEDESEIKEEKIIKEEESKEDEEEIKKEDKVIELNCGHEIRII